MAKSLPSGSSSSKKQQQPSAGDWDANATKKKITPLQIAFLVERYLADNNYAATLSSFRSEAAPLYSKTRGKDAPKGLLGLADILDEYIRLKEHKVMVDQEKRRVDALLHGIHDAVRLYQHPPNDPPLPTSTPPSLAPPNPVTVTTPLTVHRFHTTPSNANGSSPTGPHITQNAPLINQAIPALGCNPRESSSFLTPTTNSSSRRKRKMIKQVPPSVPPAPKKTRAAPEAPVVGGIRKPSPVAFGGNPLQVSKEITVAEPSPCNQLVARVPVPALPSIAKNLFKLPADVQAKLSSPKTPPQDSPQLSGDSISPAEPSQHSQPASASTSQEDTPSKCSVFSSKKIIVISPFKQSGYYSVNSSHQFSTSPMKSSSPSKPSGKRDHVKSRLDFDTEASLSSDKFMEIHMSNASNEEKMAEDIFDMDLLDLDGADFSFSQFFLDFDIDSDMNLPSEPSASCGTNFTSWPVDSEVGGGIPIPNQDSSNHGFTGVLSEKEMNIQVSGTDSIKSVKTITKCITVASSPVKNTSISLVE